MNLFGGRRPGLRGIVVRFIRCCSTTQPPFVVVAAPPLPQNTWKSFMRGRRSHNHRPKVVGWSSQQQPASCRTTPKPTHSRNHPSSTAFCPFPNLLMCLPPFPLPQELIFSNPTTSWEKKKPQPPPQLTQSLSLPDQKNPKPSPMLSSRGGRSSQTKDLFLSSPLGLHTNTSTSSNDRRQRRRSSHCWDFLRLPSWVSSGFQARSNSAANTHTQLQEVVSSISDQISFTPLKKHTAKKMDPSYYYGSLINPWTYSK